MDAAAEQPRRAAREGVAAYYESCLIVLLERLDAALNDYRGGAIDAHGADRVIHQYHRAAGALWTFCWGAGADLEFVAQTVSTWTRPIDWWERGAPRERN